MIEQWLEELGATIDESIYDSRAAGGGLCGYAHTDKLRIRYSWETVHIGWEEVFDRWANSLDWYCDLPKSKEALSSVLASALRGGERRDVPSLYADVERSRPRKIEPLQGAPFAVDAWPNPDEREE